MTIDASLAGIKTHIAVQYKRPQPMKIREATVDDAASIKNVHLRAFDKSEARVVSDVAASLLKENHPVKTISLVATENGEIVGHIAFSPIFLESTSEHFAYILAPLAVSPEFQNNKIGSSLIRHGLDIISNTGPFIVFVYGDPRYYSRFGFQTELAENFIPPFTLHFPEGWQALGSGPGVLPGSGKITCVSALENPELW